jgi:hypothetical protein
MKNNKLQPAIMHCYRELYANATPPASFDEVLKTFNNNQKNQYEISEELFEDILEDTITLFFITGKDKEKFKTKILLNNKLKFKNN